MPPIRTTCVSISTKGQIARYRLVRAPKHLTPIRKITTSLRRVLKLLPLLRQRASVSLSMQKKPLLQYVATTAPAGERIFVNEKEAATAQWINVNGDILGEVSLPAGGCTITVPAEAGFYILRVSTEKQVRNFKFLVTK